LYTQPFVIDAVEQAPMSLLTHSVRVREKEENLGAVHG